MIEIAHSDIHNGIVRMHDREGTYYINVESNKQSKTYADGNSFCEGHAAVSNDGGNDSHHITTDFLPAYERRFDCVSDFNHKRAIATNIDDTCIHYFYVNPHGRSLFQGKKFKKTYPFNNHGHGLAVDDNDEYFFLHPKEAVLWSAQQLKETVVDNEELMSYVTRYMVIQCEDSTILDNANEFTHFVYNFFADSDELFARRPRL